MPCRQPFGECFNFLNRNCLTVDLTEVRIWRAHLSAKRYGTGLDGRQFAHLRRPPPTPTLTSDPRGVLYLRNSGRLESGPCVAS